MLVIRTNHIYMYIAVGGFNVNRQIYNSCKEQYLIRWYHNHVYCINKDKSLTCRSMNLKELPIAFKCLKFHMVNTWSYLTEKLQTFEIPKANTDLHKRTSNVLKANQFKNCFCNGNQCKFTIWFFRVNLCLAISYDNSEMNSKLHVYVHIHVRGDVTGILLHVRRPLNAACTTTTLR